LILTTKIIALYDIIELEKKIFPTKNVHLKKSLEYYVDCIR